MGHQATYVVLNIGILQCERQRDQSSRTGVSAESTGRLIARGKVINDKCLEKLQSCLGPVTFSPLTGVVAKTCYVAVVLILPVTATTALKLVSHNVPYNLSAES
jgi:hypothetical protein